MIDEGPPTRLQQSIDEALAEIREILYKRFEPLFREGLPQEQRRKALRQYVHAVAYENQRLLQHLNLKALFPPQSIFALPPEWGGGNLPKA